MRIQSRFLIAILFLSIPSVSTVIPVTALAACVGTVCPLGGQLRFQIGDGLPVPISNEPAQSGPVEWGHEGGVLATPVATIMQQSPVLGTPATAPRSLMLAPGAFTHAGPQQSHPVYGANPVLFSVRTNLVISNPNPNFPTASFLAGGRSGPAIVSWCAGSPSPTAAANPGCLAPSTTAGGLPPLTNGLVRYTATRNQFGGAAFSRVVGTAQVFFNVLGLAKASLPCAGPGCTVGVSIVNPGSTGVVGAPFGASVANPLFVTPTGIYTASIGANGTVVLGAPVTNGFGANIPFTGQPATSWGFPLTTGRLTISVTQNVGSGPETFIRTGGDHRAVDGEGVVTMVAGSVSARSISGPNGNRGWATIYVPEPVRVECAAAAILTLFGLSQWSRRRVRAMRLRRPLVSSSPFEASGTM
jgi:hypothetical protein